MRFHNLDLNLLTVFDALIREQSVSKAAHYLNMGQPAVSAALGRLREFFDDELFLQNGRKMIPTDLARNLEPHVSEVLQRSRSIIFSRTKFDPLTCDRSVSISCSDFAASVILTGFSHWLANHAPNMELKIRQTPMPSTRSPNFVFESLERRGNDFAVMPEEALSSDHPSEKLFSDSYVAVAWAENSSVGKSITRRQFESFSHVVTEYNEGHFSGHENKFIQQLGYTRKATASADTFTQVAELVVNTERIAVLQNKFSKILSKRLPLKIAKLPFVIPTITECLQWKPQHNTDPVLGWVRAKLIDFSRKECKDDPPYTD